MPQAVRLALRAAVWPVPSPAGSGSSKAPREEGALSAHHLPLVRVGHRSRPEPSPALCASFPAGLLLGPF